MVSNGFTGGEIALRAAVFEDAPQVAKLHDRIWRATYRELATKAAWEGLTEAVRRERWSQVLGDPGRWITLVAEQDGEVVGFGSAGAPSEAMFEGRGEIRWLHVDPALQGRGVGRRLMSALALQLAGWGYGGCALVVVVGNERAIAFYERLGGRRAGGFTDPGPLWRSENIVFVWDALSDLVQIETA